MTPVEIEGWLASSLSPADKARADAHLPECEKCRKELHERRDQDHLFRDIQEAYAQSVPVAADHTERLSTASMPDSIEGYEVLSEIHRGGQGVVYKAVQQATKRTVALKVLLEGPYASAKQRIRFEREIDLVAGLQHPNIVTIYDSGVTGNGLHYFAMEYVKGQPLDAYLSDTSLSIDETLQLFQKICMAVSYANQRGVIHRDLKPGNIRIDVNGAPRVLDFGLAKVIGSEPQGGAPVTVTGEFMGTLAYASPEQTKGDPQLIDIRTDVYSLGVVLYEMLTGKSPYVVVGQMSEVLRNIVEAEPRKPSTIRRQINDEVETIVLKALAKERERRYQSAESLARDIEHYLNGEPIDAKRDSAWYVIRKSLRRYRIAVGVAAAFVLLSTISTIALSIMYQKQSQARKAEEDRANELQTVTEFQQSMLGGIDADKMGRGIMDELREGIRKGLENGDTTPQEVESSMASFDRLIGEVNATNLALNVVDEYVLSRAVEAIQNDFSDQPVIRASLQHTVADTYREIGLYEPAMPLQEESLRTRRRVQGDDHPETLISIDKMGRLLKAMGKYAEAELYYRESLEARRRVLGDDHPDTLGSINNMAMLLQAIGKPKKAEPYLLEALAGYHRVLGDDHPSTLSSINNMGELLRVMGKQAEALPYCLKALEGRRRVLGDDHPKTLISINNTGALLYSMGKYEEAEPYYRESLKGNRRVLGDDHPKTLNSINNVGALLYSMGKYEEAEPYYRECLKGNRRVLGDDHPETLGSINNTGHLLIRMGLHDNAAEVLLAGEDAARRVWTGGNARWLGNYLAKLGEARTGQGAFAEAEKTLLEAHGLLAAGFGNVHPRTTQTVERLISLYESWDAAKPGKGYDAKTSEWRAKLPQPANGEVETATP